MHWRKKLYTVGVISNYPIKFSQKSWCYFRWPAHFQRLHCKNCSILQVCIAQHQKDQALSHTACSTTSCPGPCHFYTGLLQCSSSWTSIMHNQTVTDDSECSSTIGLLTLPYDNLHPLKKSEICERAMPRGAITERHKITFQNIFYSLFQAGGMNFPAPSGMLNPWTFSTETWKLISSVFT